MSSIDLIIDNFTIKDYSIAMIEKCKELNIPVNDRDILATFTFLKIKALSHNKFPTGLGRENAAIEIIKEVLKYYKEL